MIRVFHRTSRDAAADIRIMGFYDSTGTYGTGHDHPGVWVSTTPLDSNEGADGDALLTLKIPVALFEQYEWTEVGKGYREAMIPAEDLNSHGQTRIVSQEAEDRMVTRQRTARRRRSNADHSTT